MLIGPDGLGKFQEVLIKSIHSKHVPATLVYAGQTASFVLKLPRGQKLKRTHIRKGMVLLDASLQVRANVVLHFV